MLQYRLKYSTSAVSFFTLLFQVKPIVQELNDSTIVEMLISEIAGFLKEGRISDAANLAIASLSTYNNDLVSACGNSTFVAKLDGFH